MSERRNMPIPEAVEINPKVKLQRGESYKFVEMADLVEKVTRVGSKETKEFKSSGAKFRVGDTLFARITPCLENGKIAKFTGLAGDLGFGSTEFIVFRGRDGITTTDYAHYLAIDPRFIDFAISKMTGSSGRQRVPVEALGHYSVSVPSIDVQKSITKVLNDLDDKIDLLREMNKTLEETARAVFRAWLVDFEPVRAKAAGATSFRGMPQELFDTLPDSFEPSVIGAIPKGWTTEALIEQGNWINGAAYKNMHFSNDADALPVVKIAELKKGVSTNTKFTNTDLGDKYRINTGDLMFSWSGSPETSIDAFIWALGDAWLNQHIFVVRPNGKKNVGYLFALLKHLKPKFIAIAKDKQTTGLGHVTRDDMKRMHVCEPNEAILDRFSEFGQNIYDCILSNLVEMEKLAALRGTLLPKFISGELKAPSLEALGLEGHK
ncbi:restriction endonuclease subunit S [Phaeobacter sp. G2]|nr:restriction endonuclease subunit S [Phaeobacter sp. G2]